MTAADWASLNPTLAKYELGIEINPATGAFNAYKVGDGVTAWTSLPYAVQLGNGETITAA